MTSTVGIDALGVAVPSTCVRLEDLAVARNVEPAKFLQGLGTRVMGVALPDEDTVTLAARAAHEALQSAGVRGDEVGLLAVGTETAVDHSKPVASYVQGLVGIGSNCRVFETKHACYGGTAALQLALDWIRSGSARGRKALVICSDIARYGVGTPGEPTQGAGAVAILLGEAPRLVALEPGVSGVYSQDVHDFWRPLYSKDALVDGHYSVKCYLDALEGAWRNYRELVAEVPPAGSFFSDRFAALAYHVPYGKLARKGHQRLRELDGDPTPDTSFARLVEPGLVLPSLVGNIYTGSLYLSLTSLLACHPGSLEGQRVGLFSYGSGSCAEFFGGTVQPGAHARVRALGLMERLEARRVLGIPEYEAIMRERELIDERPAGAATETGAFGYLGVEQERRTYARRGAA